MNNKIVDVMIQKMRNVTPLRVRIKIGPWLAWVIYYFNFHIRSNYKKPKVLSINSTVDLILKNNLSVIRFGDGEMTLMSNGDLGFQKFNQNLADKLKLVLQTNLDGLLICIPGIWGDISVFTKLSYWFIMHHLFRYDSKWHRLLSFGQIYGDAHFTRPYLCFKDKSNGDKIFKKVFSIWNDKDIVLIEGAKSRLGVQNDMFNDVKSLQRILCPSEDAFSKYEAIKNEAVKINKDKLVLISLGPAAKLLAYDLFMMGYRVIDIGHIDMEYEMFLRNETKLIKVKYKYFNEIHERNPEVCNDCDYVSQIIVNIK